jgi:hypothetical protein
VWEKKKVDFVEQSADIMEMKSYGDSNVYFDEIKQLLVKRFAFV